ncbi:CARNS1, partial [Symbiodinium sp. KB8]
AVCACAAALLSAVGASVAIALAGDGAGNGPTPSAEPYKCDSDLFLSRMVKADHKGLAIDDTTFQKCSGGIPRVWPNTQEKLTSIRLFKAWDMAWPDGAREAAWAQLLDVVKANGIKVLVGTQITCDEADDERDWRLVKELLQKLGRDHVMGVAVGNELELLYQKDYATSSCIHRLWGGGQFWRKLTQRAADLDGMAGFSDVPLTSVFGAAIFAGEPFVENINATVQTLYRDAVAKFGKRWVFTLNIYPYFDPNNALDPGSTTKCTQALTTATCFSDPRCSLPAMVKDMRRRMQSLSGSSAHLLWLGETGWSSPQASTLSGKPMAACTAFSGLSSFRKYYSNFLSWDLTVDASSRGPDHVFYFTVRDSGNFGVGEHFGLISDCNAKRCKLQSNSTLDESPLLTYV